LTGRRGKSKTVGNRKKNRIGGSTRSKVSFPFVPQTKRQGKANQGVKVNSRRNQKNQRGKGSGRQGRKGKGEERRSTAEERKKVWKKREVLSLRALLTSPS